MSAPTVQPQDVLDFWFGSQPLVRARAEWFRKDPALDAHIRDRFSSTIEQALSQQLGSWQTTVPGQLALILVLDQFTRNTCRNTPGAFAGDPLALRLAQQMVAAGDDQALPVWQRWFAYLPCEHSESHAVQAHSLQLFARLAEQDPAMADAHAWAVKHAQVVQRFGRYPHRNLVLGRVSTAEELLLLAQPGSAF